MGCAKNTVDTEAMEQLLLASGHRRAADSASADLLIVNTCGFIESAKQESIDTLLQLGEAKRGDQKLIAAGCLVERYPTELAAELPSIDAFLGARNWSALPAVVSQLEEARAPGSGPRDCQPPRSRRQRLPQNQRRLRPALRLLRHTFYERQPSQQAGRADHA
ncbi:MAG: hypothetical protein LC797_16200 [Chloroflexi bacterium]|nr:hypothetical protein [Chloroflexota bacterium]